ncbi:hypothetical protein TOPH_06807 [Tolypocladium ophioglossoides CBS 100239]|uniref:Microsomal glutathione S-transferase 3 n=1 Tax=Tolypocladium ophioglossoides (strain CBS 100239) TaxID=1163406 RepID=A0A0L0N343_TOLOC|nr:hypothetical protein TOPH_06807 [Tolypocladium ophioglossoides CBS 100239]
MPFVLELPDQYGLILAAATTTFFVNTIHVLRTSKFRKASGVKYPNAYAPAEQADKDSNAAPTPTSPRTTPRSSAPSSSPACVSPSRLLSSAPAGVSRGSSTSLATPARGAIGSSVTDSILKFMAAYASVMFVLGK